MRVRMLVSLMMLMSVIFLWTTCENTTPVVSLDRDIELSIDADMKMKMKMKSITMRQVLESATKLSIETNWFVLAITPAGEKVYAASSDEITYRAKLKIGKSWFLYVGMIVGTSTNLFPIGYPGALGVLPIRKDKSDGNSLMSLGKLQHSFGGSIKTEIDPLTLMNLTPSGIQFDIDGDGVVDFGGCIDKNFNGKPDLFEDAPNFMSKAGLSGFDNAMQSKSGSEFIFFTILFAVEPSMMIYSSSSVWSNSVVNSVLIPSVASNIPPSLAGNWTNKTVDVAMNNNWRETVSSMGMNSQWSNCVNTVTTDPKYASVLTNIYQVSTFVTFVTNNNQVVVKSTNWILNATNFILSNQIRVITTTLTTNTVVSTGWTNRYAKVMVFSNILLWQTNKMALSWQLIGTAGFTPGTIDATSILIDKTGKPVVFFNTYNGIIKGTVMRWTGSIWTNIGPIDFTPDRAYGQIFEDKNGTLIVVFQDYNGTDYKLSAMKWTGTVWTNIGARRFTASTVSYSDAAFDTNGNLYVAYGDGAYANKITVMRWDGSSWVIVGAPGFSTGQAIAPSIAIGPDNKPVVAYGDADQANYGFVKKFNGANWTNVGTNPISAGGVGQISVDVDKNNNIYVFYRDTPAGDKLTAQKWNGTGWSVLGVAGFSDGTAYYPSMVLDKSGAPVIAYRDNGNASKATVQRWNGSAWVAFGAKGFSTTIATYCCLTLDAYGLPYVFYQQEGVDNKGGVMGFK